MYFAFRISIGNDGWSRFFRKDNINKQDNLEFLIEQKFGTKNFLIGKELRKAVADNITRIFRFSYSTEMLPHPDNSVELGSKIDPVTNLPRPKINFVIDRTGTYNKDAFKMAGRVLTGLFETLNVPNTDFQVQDDQIDFAGAGHIMGTLRMGKDPKSSVVNENLQAHDHPNLFIVGSGVFPTSCTANPTLTVAALSLRLADHITSQFKSKTI
jgi:glucose dehydrogenase